MPLSKEPPAGILLGHEWTLVREGLALMCHVLPGFYVGHVDTGRAALAEMERSQPPFALLDQELSDVSVCEILRQVRERNWRTRCAILSSKRDQKMVLEALRSGASGYLLKTATAQQLGQALRHMLEGGIYMSPSIDMNALVKESGPGETEGDPLRSLASREHQVFSLLVEGVRVKEIAARLSLSQKPSTAIVPA